MADGPTTEQIAALTKSIAELGKEREKQLEQRKEMNKLLNLETSNLRLEIDLLTEQANLAKANAVMLADIQNRAGDDEEKYRVLLQEKKVALEKAADGTEKYKDEIEYLNQVLEAGTGQFKDHIEALKKEQQELLKTSVASLKLKKRTEDLSTATGALSGNIFNITGRLGKKGFAGALAEGLTKGVDFKGLLGDMATKFKSLNIVGNIFANTFARVKELADLQAGIRQATGAGAEMNNVFTDSYRDTLTMGVQAAETAEAVKTLYSEFAGFTDLSATAQQRLATLTSTLKFYGLSAQEVATTQNFLQKGLQMTAEEAEATQTELVALGKALGVPPKIINRDFAIAGNVIAQFGDKGVGVFKQLAAQAKATGASMSTLLAFAEGFDMFDTAADKVGNLNAIMGGAFFDTMEMVGANEAERIEIAKRNLELAGKDFSSMKKREKQMFANALGISDMTEANHLFGNTLEDIAAQEAKLFKTGKMGWKELTEGAKGAMSMSDKLNGVFNRMELVMQPLVDVVMDLLTGFLDLVEFMDPFWKGLEKIFGWVFLILGPIAKLVMWVGAFVGGIMLLLNPLTWLIGALAAIGAWMENIAGLGGKVESSIDKATSPSKWFSGEAVGNVKATAINTPGTPGPAISESYAASTHARGAALAAQSQAAAAPRREFAAPAPAAAQAANSTIILQVDGRQFAKAIVDPWADKTFNLSTELS
tara:strand:- start:3242 stop:5365 length:2124 start_codon:yes stop_codon:yes gene_type:complete